MPTQRAVTIIDPEQCRQHGEQVAMLVQQGKDMARRMENVENLVDSVHELALSMKEMQGQQAKTTEVLDGIVKRLGNEEQTRRDRREAVLRATLIDLAKYGLLAIGAYFGLKGKGP